MAVKDDLANRVLQAVQGDNEAIKKLSDALAQRDPTEIRRVFDEVAKVKLSEEEANALVRELGSNAAQEVAYVT